MRRLTRRKYYRRIVFWEDGRTTFSDFIISTIEMPHSRVPALHAAPFPFAFVALHDQECNRSSISKLLCCHLQKVRALRIQDYQFTLCMGQAMLQNIRGKPASEVHEK